VVDLAFTGAYLVLKVILSNEVIVKEMKSIYYEKTLNAVFMRYNEQIEKVKSA